LVSQAVWTINENVSVYYYTDTWSSCRKS
jgi:hypothetical protein